MRRRTRLLGVGVFVVVGFFVWLLVRPGPELEGVERPSNDGRGHIAGATYIDAAPTSGRHRSSAPACGVYPTPLDLDLAVHALEHGSVVFWYDRDSPELVEGLTEVLAQFDSHVIVSPNEGLTAPIVATAWNRRLELDDVNEDAFAFASTYRRRGPERVPCDINT